ncbi:MAG: HDOD domain-containing protein [Phycisphaerae bacterium]
MSTATAEASAKSGSIEAVLKHVVEISTLPQIALQVMEVAKDPDAGAADLKRVVEGDPSLSARVLRMVNSAAYGMRTQVTNLHQAISYLGFNQVRNLAMTASVSEIFKGNQTIGTYQRAGLWKHLVSVGVAARFVAVRRGLKGFEDAFLAGLLHDIGIILLDQHVHDQFRAVIQSLRDGTPLCDTEQEILGFNHAMLGARIAETWNFPPVTRAAIRYHHMSQNHRGDGAELVHCVEVANVICTLKGISSVGMKLTKPPIAALQALNFSKDDVLVLARDLDNELKQNEGLLEL